MQAKDVMSSPVVTVGPDESVHAVARLLLEQRISAVPVVDSERKLVGILSEGDLIHRAEIGTEHAPRSWWLSLVADGAEAARHYVKSHGMKVADLMTRDVVTVGEETSLTDIAELLEEKHIKRVPVVRDGVVVGIVSRANLLQALTAHKARPLAPASRDDRTIRENLVAKLGEEPWANAASLNVIVTDGVVHLWGFVDSSDQRRALRVLAESVEGVKGVEDHLGTAPGYIGGV